MILEKKRKRRKWRSKRNTRNKYSMRRQKVKQGTNACVQQRQTNLAKSI